MNMAMNIIKRIVSPGTLGLDVIRLVVCAILFTHGAHRLYTGEAGDLADAIRDKGFPLALVLAYAICLAETGGTVLLAARILVVPICLILSFIYIMGIILFQAHHGFFVLGAGTGGWEYPLLIITCLLATAWENRR